MGNAIDGGVLIYEPQFTQMPLAMERRWGIVSTSKGMPDARINFWAIITSC